MTGFEWTGGVLRNSEMGNFQLQFLQISERVSHLYRLFSRGPQEYKRPYDENVYRLYGCIILCRCCFISFICSCLLTVTFYQLTKHVNKERLELNTKRISGP
jgi:hypothetical protein